MVDHQNEYASFINELSEEDFNALVVAFEKEYWNTNDVALTNGPYDGGNDIVVRRKNGTQVMHTIQITVQQDNLKKKFKADLEKARDNHDKKGYEPILDYFIKKNLSNSKKDDIRHKAEVDYGITLNLYDINFLAAGVPNYDSLLRTLTSLHNEIYPNINFQLDQRTIQLFDELSLSGNVTEIKLNFVQSLVLSFLYQNKNKTFKVGQIFESLSDSFDKGMNKGWFGGVIGKMKTCGLIIDVGQLSPKEYALTGKAIKALDEIELRGKISEAQLFSDVKMILDKFSVKAVVKEVIQILTEIYDANYAIDETEYLNNTSNGRIRTAYSHLSDYFKSKGVEDKVMDSLKKSLLDACKNNKSLDEVSISKMFMNMLKSQHLENYLSNNPRDVFLDTQILLRIICMLNIKKGDENDDLDDIRNMFENKDSSKVHINFFTTSDYIEETAWHIIDAIKLERFLSLPYIRSLGKSKNVIFNLYLKYNENDQELSFNDFIYRMFGVQVPNTDLADYSRISIKIASNLRDTFANFGIYVHELPKFDNYGIYKKTYEDIYNDLARDGYISKSTRAIYNDLRTTLLLSKDYKCSEESLFKEPFLITWDQSFYKFRSRMREAFPELKNWFIYSPTKFANTISLLNFKIDTKAINYNIVSIVEDRFKYSNNNISFIDTLNKFYDKKDLSNWMLGRKLAEMRQNIMDEQELNMHQDNNLPIDIFLLNLYQYYNNPKNEHDYKSLVSLLMSNKYADKIIVVIKDNLNKEFNDDVVKHFDELIHEHEIVDIKIEGEENEGK